MKEFNIKDFIFGYRRNHHSIEFSTSNYKNAKLDDYKEVKDKLILDIEWQINYLVKQKEMLNELR